MAYQKSTNASYGSRVKNAFNGVFTGLLLLIAGIVLLFWNEGRAVKTTRMLKESQSVCMELGSLDTVREDMNGQMIHATGMATTDDILTDNFFGVSANAVKLSRSVEYYQWVEHQESKTRDKIGGGQETVTTYTYTREWTSGPVNSADFEDPEYQGIDNRVLVEIEDEYLQAENVGFGAYRLPAGLVSQMNRSRPLAVTLDPGFAASLEQQLRKVRMPAEADSLAQVSSGDSLIHVRSNVIYLGRNNASPEVGDVRVTFENVLPGEVSILAKVYGDTFEAFTAKNGYTLLTLRDGAISMENMYEGAHKGNKTTTWILRILGILLIYFGFRSIFDIITAILKVLPFLANIASLGIGLVSFVLTLVIGLVVIAIAWLTYRPVLGVALLAAAAALIWYLSKRSREVEPADSAE